jgi:hypothetical protein
MGLQNGCTPGMSELELVGEYPESQKWPEKTSLKIKQFREDT